MYNTTICALPRGGLDLLLLPTHQNQNQNQNQITANLTGPLWSAFTYIPSPPTKDLDDFWRDGRGEGDADEDEGFMNGVCEG